MSVEWNERLLEDVAARLVPALDEIDMRIETGAKAELYPGHGKITGTLQRSIHSRPARRQGSRVVGAVGTEPLPYALKIHLLYRYLLIGLQKTEPHALRILERHVRRRG
jgi:hypothetical protein